VGRVVSGGHNVARLSVELGPAAPCLALEQARGGWRCVSCGLFMVTPTFGKAAHDAQRTPAAERGRP
jgi:hypothetical protein